MQPVRKLWCDASMRRRRIDVWPVPKNTFRYPLDKSLLIDVIPSAVEGSLCVSDVTVEGLCGCAGYKNDPLPWRGEATLRRSSYNAQRSFDFAQDDTR